MAIDIEKKYKRKNSLIRLKLIDYIPILVISNISTLLILTVDGIVVGNYVGAEALAAVQIFYPVTVLLGVFSAIISNGTAQCLSAGIVKHDYENLKYIKAAILKVIFISVIFVAIIQIPIVFAILKSYNLEPELYNMTKEYAIGIMISMPFGLISAVSVCQLQIAGKMKTLMILAIIEGVLNLGLDLLFVGKLKLGVVGAGFGSSTASVTRSLLTLYYIHFKTDTYKGIDVKARIEDIKSIVRSGLPEATSIFANAFQSYVMVRLLLHAFEGSTGATIKGVCTFCFSLVGVAISSLQGAMRPLLSIMTGSDDKVGLYNTMRIAFRNILVAVGIISIAMQIKPEVFYHLHGIKDIPEYGVFSLRLYVTYFIFYGFNTIYRLYFVNKGDTKFATTLTLVGNLTLPVFAYALFKVFAPPYIWLGNTVTAVLIFVINTVRYISFVKKDRESASPDEKTLYLSVKSEEALEASKDIADYAKEKGYPMKLVNDISLCFEEMISYAVKSQNRIYFHVQIIVKFLKDKARFVMLDDGKCIHLDEDKEKQQLAVDNYDFIKKLAKTYDYQYLLNMNYTTLNFECA